MGNKQLSYSLLSPREREVLDLLMDSRFSSGKPELASVIAEMLGVGRNRIKRLLGQAALKYGIHDPRFNPTVRLVYLRAKELGLIQ